MRKIGGTPCPTRGCRPWTPLPVSFVYLFRTYGVWPRILRRIWRSPCLARSSAGRRGQVGATWSHNAGRISPAGPRFCNWDTPPFADSPAYRNLLCWQAMGVAARQEATGELPDWELAAPYRG